MKWNEVTRIDVKGPVIALKDAMIMLSEDELESDWPSISCAPGEYVLEIFVPEPFYAHRVRLRRSDSTPELGNEIGKVSVDHACVAFIDYEPFLAAVKEDFESYEEWTMMQLDDELSLNFSGEIEFRGQKLVYVKSVDGDGVFPAFELRDENQTVGIECVLVA